MLTNSRDIKSRLEREGWRVDRARGSHYVYNGESSERRTRDVKKKPEAAATIGPPMCMGRPISER
jgi:predicted RNA binding protein YcfA (HicA-like mRNA interferase family)